MNGDFEKSYHSSYTQKAHARHQVQHGRYKIRDQYRTGLNASREINQTNALASLPILKQTHVLLQRSKMTRVGTKPE